MKQWENDPENAPKYFATVNFLQMAPAETSDLIKVYLTE